MATDITLPKIGFAMNEGSIAEWHAADGAAVTQGQTLYSLESDKSVTEVESPATGILRIRSAAGQVYPVGHLLATIE